jgi:hypothetical protein
VILSIVIIFYKNSIFKAYVALLFIEKSIFEHKLNSKMKTFSVEIKWTFRFILLTLAWAIGEKFIGLHDQYIEDYAVYTNLFVFPAILFFFQALKECQILGLTDCVIPLLHI